jgi:hypothetical protein
MTKSVDARFLLSFHVAQLCRALTSYVLRRRIGASVAPVRRLTLSRCKLCARRRICECTVQRSRAQPDCTPDAGVGLATIVKRAGNLLAVLTVPDEGRRLCLRTRAGRGGAERKLYAYRALGLRWCWPPLAQTRKLDFCAGAADRYDLNEHHQATKMEPFCGDGRFCDH